MLEQRVEGLIYASGFHREVTLPPIAFDVPTVLVHCFDAPVACRRSCPTRWAAGTVATRHLIEAGHRRIGFINLEPARRPRAAGSRATAGRCARRGSSPRTTSWSSDDSSPPTAATRPRARCWTSTDRPTAIFCGTDRMAMGAYDAIKERGLSIPADVAVVGFDNQELIAAYLRPKLTTVALPFEEMGARGVEMLGAALDSRAADRHPNR